MILAGKVGLINGVEGYQVYTVLYLALGESVEVLSVGISHHAAKGDEDTTWQYIIILLICPILIV